MKSTGLPMLQEQIRSCRRCVDAGYLSEARPLTSGDAGAKFMVIGQAPSRTAHETHTMYRGPAGEKLRLWFVEAGFGEHDLGFGIYFAAITKCFPGRLAGSSKDRLPSKSEQALCRPWLDTEISIVNPRVIVLFGGLAITTFLSKLPLSELIVKTFEKDGRIMIPLPHSSGASTWLNGDENKTLLRNAIDELRKARIELLSADSRTVFTSQWPS